MLRNDGPSWRCGENMFYGDLTTRRWCVVMRHSFPES